MAVAFALAVFFRFFGEVGFFVENLLFIIPSVIAFSLFNLIVMIALGVHQASVEEGMSGMMLRTIMAMILAIPLHGFAYFVADDWLWYLGSFGLLTSAMVLAIFSLGIARVVFFAVVGKDRFKRRVLVLGAGRRAKQMFEDLTTPFNRKGFSLDGFVPMPDDAVEVDEQYLINLPTSLH